MAAYRSLRAVPLFRRKPAEHRAPQPGPFVVEAVAPNKPGRVEFCGTTWKAESAATLPVGASVRIAGKKNLTLKVEAIES